MANPLSDHPWVRSHLAFFEAWLETHMAYAGLPGFAVGIVHDGEVIHAKGFGYADAEAKTPCGPDTLFRIASHSKLFTSIAVMQLRDANKLGLDDPVKKYLPWFGMGNPYPDAPPVTIRQLLTHTSGLPREGGRRPYWTGFEFPDREEVIGSLTDQSVVYPPGERWKYSNLALSLAGEIVAAVSGNSYPEYVAAHILKPLGMNNTFVELPDGERGRLAAGYGRRMPAGNREKFPFMDARGIAAAAGLSSTVNDMAKFMAWQMRLRETGGGGVLKASTLREMQRPHWTDPDWRGGRGLGFNIRRWNGRTLAGHGGAYPGYRTASYFDPGAKFGVVAFSNALDAEVYCGQTWSVTERLFDWIAPAVEKAAAGIPCPDPDPAWGNYVGLYRNIWRDGLVIVLGGRLMFIDDIHQPNPLPDACVLEPLGGNRFRMEGGGDLPIGEVYEFETGADGRAAALRTAGWTAVRVSI